MHIPAPRPAPDDEPPRVIPAVTHAAQDPRRRAITVLGLLTGLWVTISLRFLTLQQGGTNVAADVIIGLAVVGIGILALVGQRGFSGLRFTGLVLGIWAVLISSFILDATVSNAAPVYWSNTCSGAVMAVLALTELATLRPAAGRPRVRGL
jgi:hypothetical protein